MNLSDKAPPRIVRRWKRSSGFTSKEPSRCVIFSSKGTATVATSISFPSSLAVTRMATFCALRLFNRIPAKKLRCYIPPAIMWTAIATYESFLGRTRFASAFLILRWTTLHSPRDINSRRRQWRPIRSLERCFHRARISDPRAVAISHERNPFLNSFNRSDSYNQLGDVVADAFSKSVNFASWFCSRSETTQKFIPELAQRITW